VHVSICYPMGVVDTEANRRSLGRDHGYGQIAPQAIGRAFVSAASAGEGGRLLEVPVHPNRA
jgi:hypothetical protein